MTSCEDLGSESGMQGSWVLGQIPESWVRSRNQEGGILDYIQELTALCSWELKVMKVICGTVVIL